MAAEAVRIDEERQSAGRELLALTDHIGFDAVGAAWVYSAASDRWHYVLVTPMIDSKGPRWIFERLLRVFQKLPLPAGITPLDIRVSSPDETWFRRFPVQSMGGEVSVGKVVVNSEVVVDAAHVYRMASEGLSSVDRAPQFDKRVSELLAA